MNRTLESEVSAALRADMNTMTFSPLLTAPLSIKTKTYRLAILGAIVGILGQLSLLVAILALAGLALASALLARLAGELSQDHG